ncbi:hypothetical protein [Comamonas testosteroni]|jgi:hypothetical protein|uniref:hypothetical protein n=1 Tax=Comamonas testosteroni TaxID=285 RepID=UPI0026F37312|nr:hypothetical protein [Comamonas testosteroni]
MDANHFLNLRLDMIANFYQLGSAPFRAITAAIEAKTPPYDKASTGDSPEPPCLEKWQQAQDSVDLLGAVSVSLLAGALQVFLDTMVKLYGDAEEFSKASKKLGWWGKHQSYFKGLGLDFGQSGADLELLSAMILARNSVMHQEGLTNSVPVFRDKDMREMKSEFFISPFEHEMLKGLDEGEEDSFLFAPNVHVDEAKLTQAITEVRTLTRWLESAIWAKLQQQNPQTQP